MMIMLQRRFKRSFIFAPPFIFVFFASIFCSIVFWSLQVSEQLINTHKMFSFWIVWPHDKKSTQGTDEKIDPGEESEDDDTSGKVRL